MGNKEICNEQGDGKQRQAADFQFERFPPGEFLLHLDGLRDDAVAIDQGVSINNLLFDRNGLSGGLCLQRMMQTPSDTEAADLAYLFSRTDAVSRVDTRSTMTSSSTKAVS